MQYSVCSHDLPQGPVATILVGVIAGGNVKNESNVLCKIRVNVHLNAGQASPLEMVQVLSAMCAAI